MPAGDSSVWLVRAGRAALLIAAAAVLFLAARREREQVQPAITLAEVRQVFPTAARVGKFDPERRAHAVHGEGGGLIGYVLTTSPEADDLVGYSGPSNLLIGLDPEQKIRAVRFLTSRDTPAHVDEVRRDKSFWKQFTGRTFPGADDQGKKVEAVSGSTLTSLAMAEGVERRLSGKTVSYRFPEPLSLEEVREVFADAASIHAASQTGWFEVKKADAELLGFAVRTSPVADNILGYKGPTETWAAVDRERKKLLAVRLRKSYDTEEYVERVRESTAYLDQLAGRSLEDWAKIDFKAAGIEGVSGATQTSFAVAEDLRIKFEADAKERAISQTTSWLPRPRDFGMFALIAGALAISFSKWKGNRRLRLAWQIILVLGFGLWLGDLISIALFNGWAKNGIAWQTAPGLAALAAIALIVPWTTKRQIYCHHLCPHGAAQELVGKFRWLHIKLPERLSKTLAWLPMLLLAFAFVASVITSQIDLSLLEPFDAWALKFATLVPACLAIAGLVASVFSPMAYCRFGCPTGALLKLIQSHAAERFRWRDGIAAALILSGFVFVLRPEPELVTAEDEPMHATAKEFSGKAFGTTWQVKFRTPVAATLETNIGAELERIESTLSHWRPESHTSQFNASRTTLAMEMPPELLSLVAFGQELSTASDGAYDITVAPLVDAWGFGPSGPQKEPTEEELQTLLQNVGYQRLEVDLAERTLRKKKPGLKIDLGSLLQGYAADRVAALLDEAGVTEYLVEVGGEMKARGSWTVAIENPTEAANPLRTITLKDAALATSGVYRSAGHILDPRTGRPVMAKWQLVAVIRPRCLQADGWATALLVASEKATEIAEREQIGALFQSADGTIAMSAAWKEAAATAPSE